MAVCHCVTLYVIKYSKFNDLVQFYLVSLIIVHEEAWRMSAFLFLRLTSGDDKINYTTTCRAASALHRTASLEGLKTACSHAFLFPSIIIAYI